MSRSGAILTSKSILIIDDNAYVAIDIAASVEVMGGTVVGPVTSLDEVMVRLASVPVDAAVLDADVAGAAAIAARLAGQQIPFVVQAGSPLGVGLRGLCNDRAVLFRPVDSSLIVNLLAVEMAKAGRQDADTMSNPLSLPPVGS